VTDVPALADRDETNRFNLLMVPAQATPAGAATTVTGTDHLSRSTRGQHTENTRQESETRNAIDDTKDQDIPGGSPGPAAGHTRTAGDGQAADPA
jgi:hypothetical protein